MICSSFAEDTRHHQLKNFISTSDPAIIYYASGSEVYALHKSSRKRELVASLNWIPQCLDAAHGWICVGGPEGGACAFISVGEAAASSTGHANPSHSEVDALLPLDLDPESRMLDQFPYTGSRPTRASRRKPEVQYSQMGTSIVNSVTIYRLQSGGQGLLDETVVIVTWVLSYDAKAGTDLSDRNNDQSVRIFSLTQSRILGQLQFSTPMNHATISPDQELLVAVGDEPRAFFCKRMRLPNGETSYANYEWLEVAEPRLSLADPTDACFATAWSPSGHICAVASQTGVVTIFDTAKIVDDMEEDEAVIGVLKSSRPVIGRDLCGAVRSMSFAPEPWDLLVWAEDQGRVCVTDLRNAFRSRQTIQLETDLPGLDRAVMVDAEIDDDTAEQRQMQIEARFLRQEARDNPDYPAAINRTADYLELAARRTALRRRHLHDSNEPLSELYGDLSESERRTIEAVGRSRLAPAEQPSSSTLQRIPYPTNYSQNLATNEPFRQSNLHAPTHSSSSPGPLTGASITGQSSRQTESIREYLRNRGLEHPDRTRTGTRSYQPRRRSSVVISNTNANNQSSSSHPSSLAPIGTATPTLSTSPSRLASTATLSNMNTSTSPPPFSATGGDPWQTISDAMASSTTAPVENSRVRREFEETRSRVAERQAFQQRPSEALSRHDRLLRASNPQGRLATSQSEFAANSAQTLNSVRALTRDGLLDGEQLAMARMDANSIYRPAWRSRRDLDGGVSTMGVGWSRDGRNL